MLSSGVVYDDIPCEASCNPRPGATLPAGSTALAEPLQRGGEGGTEMGTRIALTGMVVGMLAGLVSPAGAQRRDRDRDRDREPRDGVCIYKDADYRGQRLCVGAGEEVDELPWGLDDEVSSIRVFGRAEITIYRDRNFRGASTRFDDDVRDLQYERWNDRVSSIRVTGRSYGGGSRPGYGSGSGGGYGSGSGGNGGYGSGGGYRGSDPDVIVRRAYQDVLDREPDEAGLRQYRRRIIDDGWTEREVREALRNSAEYREKTTMTWPKAQEIVRRAYLAVLNREPDGGSRGYVDKVMREGWTQADVERELRRSDEYRNRR
jgi:hypothetical protein